MISAKAFHPMKGHVCDGADVLFSNGSHVTIKGGMNQWLIMENGKAVEALPADANEVAGYIFNREYNERGTI